MADRLLLRLKLVETQGIGVVGGFGFLASLFEFEQAALLLGDFGLSLLVLAGKAGQNLRAQHGNPLGWEAHAGPERSHGILHVADRDIPLWAARLIMLATQAVEVGVGVAGTSPLGDGNAEPPTATGTVERAFQVVRPLVALVPVRVTGGQQGLHPVEGGRVDQRRMFALVGDAAELYPAGVVAVAEDAVHVLHADWSFRQALIGGQPQALVIGVVDDVGQGAQAGIVEPEALGNHRGIGLVNLDDADVFAERGDLHSGIDVAERRSTGRAADLDLLTHAFLGFFAQVGGVPLGDVGHNTVDQLAGRAVIDVLGAGH